MIIKHVPEAVSPETDTNKLPDVEAMILEKTEELRLLCFNAKRQCIIIVDAKGKENGGGTHFWNMRTGEMAEIADGEKIDSDGEIAKRAFANLFSMVNQFSMALSQGQLGLANVEQIKAIADGFQKQSLDNVRHKTALETIADYDEKSIWTDSRDDAADGMLAVAREALGRKD